MGAEHLLLDSAEAGQALPFARGRVAQLRAAGFQYVTKRYELLGLDVRVTLQGEDAYIEIRGGGWDYLVWPTSSEHPAGVVLKEGKTVEPRAVLTLTGTEKGLRRKENVDLLAGPHDWISADHKKVLTYDHGHGFRYALQGAYEVPEPKAEIFRGGARIRVQHGVRGCALAKFERPDGSKPEYLVYAAYEARSEAAPGMALVVLYRVDPKDKDEAGVAREVEFARWEVVAGEDLVLAQPMFFDGTGQHCVAVLETVIATGTPPDEVVFNFGGPRYALRGTLFIDSAGELQAEFDMQMIAATPSQDSQTTNEQRHNPADPFFVWGSLQNDFYEYSDESPDPNTRVITSSAASSGYSRTTTTSRTARVVGLDLAPNGAELLIERITDTYAQTYQEENEQNASSATLLYNQFPDEPARVLYAGSGSFANTQRQGGVSRVTQRFIVNGSTLYQIQTAESSNNTTRNSSWSYQYSLTPNPPSPPPATVTTTSSQSSVQRTFALRDLDARWQALGAVVGSHPQPFDGSLRPYSVTLHAQCQGQQFDRVIFDGQVVTPPAGATQDRMGYRAIAARRPDEFVISLSPETTPHQDPANTPFLDHLAFTGSPDRAPLIALRRKDKAIQPGPDKFSIGEEPGFRLDPVHLL